MGNRYIVKQQNITPTAGNDILTILSVTGRRGRVIEVSVAGRGTSSAAQQIEVGRSTGGTTGGGAVTPGKFDHTDEPAAAFTYDTTWSVQPTLDTNSEVIGWNALGGANRWIPPKGSGLEFRGAGTVEQISFRASAGVTFQAMSLSTIIEED
jgi:hypothetical protein